MVVYAICICLFGFSLCAGFTLGWFGTVGAGPSVLIVFRGFGWLLLDCIAWCDYWSLLCLVVVGLIAVFCGSLVLWVCV